MRSGCDSFGLRDQVLNEANRAEARLMNLSPSARHRFPDMQQQDKPEGLYRKLSERLQRLAAPSLSRTLNCRTRQHAAVAWLFPVVRCTIRSAAVYRWCRRSGMDYGYQSCISLRTPPKSEAYPAAYQALRSQGRRSRTQTEGSPGG